jgi:hypothetical protein
MGILSREMIRRYLQSASFGLTPGADIAYPQSADLE